MWGGLIDYWKYIGDTSFVETTQQGLLAQIGPAQNFIMPQQTFDEGNDDQVFWCLASMSAAETDFPNPSSPSWLQLSENCFNNQISRWDTTTCGGGLKWQIYSQDSYGYNYKNSVSNGGLFQLAARLALYTGNSTYSNWANTVWNWTNSVGLMDSNYNVYDGANDETNCSPVSPIQWTYNVGIYMYGAATMYNLTGQQGWLDRTNGLIQASKAFFWPESNSSAAMYEPACEPYNTCDNDQYSFKAYLGRWLGQTTILAPSTAEAIYPLLQTSATAAAQSCSGGSDGVTCGTKWYTGGWDGTNGAGQQLSALEIVQSLLVANGGAPTKQTSQQNADPSVNNVKSATSATSTAPKVQPTTTVVDKMQAAAIHASDALVNKDANNTMLLNGTSSATSPSRPTITSITGSMTATATPHSNAAHGSWIGADGVACIAAGALAALLAVV